LGEAHLNDAIRLKTSKYTLRNFPYREALSIFLSAKDRRGLDRVMDQSAGPSTAEPETDFSMFEPEDDVL
jgi:hypothetical protein